MQAVLLYGSKTWLLLDTMERKVERIHTGFIRQIKGKKSRQQRDGKWEKPGAEGMREAAGTQLAKTYIVI